MSNTVNEANQLSLFFTAALLHVMAFLVLALALRLLCAAPLFMGWTDVRSHGCRSFATKTIVSPVSQPRLGAHFHSLCLLLCMKTKWPRNYKIWISHRMIQHPAQNSDFTETRTLINPGGFSSSFHASRPRARMIQTASKDTAILEGAVGLSRLLKAVRQKNDVI